MNTSSANHYKESTVLAKLLVGDAVQTSLIESLDQPWQDIANRLAGLPNPQRSAVFEQALADLDAEQRDPIRRAVFAADPGADVTDIEITGFPLTDVGNAESLVAMYGNNLRYDHRRRRWLLWQDHRWKPDEDGEITRLAIQSVRRRYHATAEVFDKEKKRESIKWALTSESKNKIEALIKLATTLHPITDRGDSWDQDHWLLGCPNGVVDLRTGDVRPGRPQDHITMQTGAEYHPDASAPRWNTFLQEIFNGDAELIQFIQRAIGYSMTGDTREQCLFLCWGAGANGKSTMLETIRLALGDYAANTPFSTFEMRQNDSASNDVAALVGKRLITASETNEARRLNEARAKAVTGGDPVTARFLFGEFFTFIPTFKVWLAMNHKPIVMGTDEGIWRRIRLIPFSVSFRDRPDKTLSQTLRAELPGVLNWMVQGVKSWLENGLAAPTTVLAATDAYRVENDIVRQFVESACLIHPDARVKGGDLYRAYKEWCETENEQPITSSAFGRRVKEHQGISADRVKGNVWYFGIGIPAD